jgi:hypothetical protein
MFRRQHALAALIVLGLSPLVVGGCSSDSKATPRVTLDTQIALGSHTTVDCPDTANGTWFQVGSFGNPAAGTNPDGTPTQPVVPVDDGGSFGQGTATVTCAVTAEGTGFHVSATVSLSGATGGAFRIDGHFEANGDQGNIDTSMTAQGRGTYNQKDCVVRYAQPGETVAAGRVWGDIDCPNGTQSSTQRICHMQGEFRFENCAQ